MIQKLYSWYGKRTVWTISAVLLILIAGGLIFKQQQLDEPQSEVIIQTLAVASVSELAGESSLSLLGTVESISEADIQSEVAGRVTSVSVSLGQEIRAGQAIASLENARERAAVLQAEGAYEATLASASVSDISSQQAENQVEAAASDAINAVQNSYTTVSNGFFTVIDVFYNNPNSPLTYPLITNSNRSFLSAERVAFQDIFSAWQMKSGTLTSHDEIYEAIDESLAYTNRTRVIVDSFLLSLQERKSETFLGQPVTTFIDDLSALRNSLEATNATLNNAKTELQNAVRSFEQAQIAGTTAEVSTANAQVKQALGALQAAQANLNKTILRSPIAGTVNSLNVKVGDFLGGFQSIARVANNDALQITVFVGESDRAAIDIGSEVLIDNQFAGVVTNIGAGIDPQTQKTEVKIATETAALTNGDTVTVSVAAISNPEVQTALYIPISAIKFSADAGSVFTIENDILVEHPITIGGVRGAKVEVIEGLTKDMVIVTDARGLTAGAQAQAQQ